MFCPKCATQNVDGASFCRSCGANISLVSQALNGQSPKPAPIEEIERAFRRRKRKEPSLDEGIRHLFMGLAFVIVSILIGKYSPGGWTWWYWMLIPAFTFLGRGVSDIVRARQLKTSPPVVAPPQVSAGVRLESLPSLRTGELRSPVPSVTEGTTRHLGAEAPTRHFDPVTGEEKVS